MRALDWSVCQVGELATAATSPRFSTGSQIQLGTAPAISTFQHRTAPPAALLSQYHCRSLREQSVILQTVPLQSRMHTQMHNLSFLRRRAFLSPSYTQTPYLEEFEKKLY